MMALGRLPPDDGISAMQAINVAVLNPVFFTAFFGTAALSTLAVIFALIGCRSRAQARGLLYLIGTIDDGGQRVAQQQARARKA